MTTIFQDYKPKSINVKDVIKLPYYFINGVRYHAAGQLYIPKPLNAGIHVTRRCNSKCVMCLDWRRQTYANELSLSEIEMIFRNSLFQALRRVIITGGEPTLREDLAEISQIILDSCPKVKEIHLLTNGLDPDLVISRLNELLSLKSIRSLNRFVVSVSLDGYGDMHENIRRIPQAFEKVTETIKRLQVLQKNIPFGIHSTCVVQPLNVDQLTEITSYAKDLHLSINFVPVWIYEPLADRTGKDSLRFNKQQIEALKTVLYNQLNTEWPLSTVTHWQEYFNIISGKQRKLPCHLLYQNVFIDSDGTLYICAPSMSSLRYGNSRDEPPDKIWFSKEAQAIRKRVSNTICRKCTQTCNTALTMRNEFFYIAGVLINKQIKKLIGK